MFDPDFASPSDWARMYRALPLQVVPCRGKQPALPWKQLQQELTPDETFQEWYGQAGTYVGSYDMGVLCGACSRDAFCVDLDEHKNRGAKEWFDALLGVHNNGVEPETWQQRTGGGGRQLFFKAPAGWTAPTCRTDRGIDIRGQGGFAVIPPTRHKDSGKQYAWIMAPWETELAEAPRWLCDAIDQLVRENGGGKVVNIQRAPQAGDFNDFGLRVDGREDFMTQCVWGALVDLYRSCPIKPIGPASMEEAYQRYERQVKPRMINGDISKSELLDQEGRGITLYRTKWERGLTKWDTEVRAAAMQGNGVSASAPPTGTDIKQWLYSSAAFVAEFVPPDYLIHGVIQKGYIYSLTAATGTGKTAVLLMIAAHVDQGAPIGSRKVKRGRVLYLAGENPNDVRMRWFAQTQQVPFALTPEDMTNTIFMPLVVALSSGIARIKQELAGQEIGLVVVDTAAAYSEAQDENANVDQRRQAQILRQLLSLPGGPAVIVACHPPKNADADHLEPRGGGAFVAEIDGNLYLRKNDGALELHHTDKFRGAEFPPLHFRLETVTHERLKDGEGNKILTVVAHYVGDIERGTMKENAIMDQDLILMAINQYPTESERERAKAQGWLYKTGEPNQKRVSAAIKGLLFYGLIKKDRRGYQLTEKGQKECKKLQLQTASK